MTTSFPVTRGSGENCKRGLLNTVLIATYAESFGTTKLCRWVSSADRRQSVVFKCSYGCIQINDDTAYNESSSVSVQFVNWHPHHKWHHTRFAHRSGCSRDRCQPEVNVVQALHPNLIVVGYRWLNDHPYVKNAGSLLRSKLLFVMANVTSKVSLPSSSKP